MSEKKMVSRNVAIALVIGLVIGLALGLFVSALFNSLSLFRNQVQVSGTVQGNTSNTLYFQNVNQTILATATITNGQYSVLLWGGQTYYVYNNNPTIFEEEHGCPPLYDYNYFYVPLNVTTFTENLMGVF